MHSRFVSLLSESLVSLASRIAFATILVEEIIYDRLIKLASIELIFEVNFIDAQLAEIRIIIIEFYIALSKAQLEAT